MAVNPEGSASSAAEVAAHRRWLITIAITILFGGFGAVMAYLSYARTSRPSSASPGRSRSPATSPSLAPSTSPPVAAPAAPSKGEGTTETPDRPKDQDKEKDSHHEEK